MKKIFLSLSLLFLFACGGNDKAKDEKETPTQNETTKTAATKKTENQDLNLFLGAEPKSLDISRSTDIYSSAILGLTNEGLVGAINQNGQDIVVPAGATSWSISPDNLVWTFNLRKNSVWADGEPVIAEHYYYGITRTLDPNVGSNYSFFLYPIKGAKTYNSGKGTIDDVGIKVINDHTLEITLENPTPHFIQLAYSKVMYPQRKDIVNKYGEAYGSKKEHILSNGPYLLTEWIHSNKVIFERNPNYWDNDSHKLNKINMTIVTDENSRMNLLTSAQIDMGYTDKPEWINQFMNSGQFNHRKRQSLGINFTLFNTTSKYFKNAKIRKAFSLALNREEINNVMFSGNFEPAFGFVSKGISIGDKEYRSVVSEPLKKLIDKNIDPIKLLSEGLTELGMDPDPKNMTVTYISTGTGPWDRKYSELLQQMLKQNLGVNMLAEFVEWPVYLKRTSELDYEMGGQSCSADYNDPNTFLDMWMSDANTVPTGWANAQFDELIKKAALTSNHEDRLKYFQKAEDLLVSEECVIAPTLYRVSNSYIRKYVKNYNPTSLANYNYKGVYIDGRN